MLAGRKPRWRFIKTAKDRLYTKYSRLRFFDLRIEFRIFLALLFLSLPFSQAFAQESSSGAGGVEYFPGAYARGVSTASVATTGAESKMKKAFASALNRIQTDEMGLAAKHLSSLQQTASEEGYLNLSDYSMDLLSVAQQAESEGKTADVRFLASHAVELSPRDPRVLFLAASLYSSIGWSSASSYAIEGLKKLPEYPLVAATLMLNTVLLLLAAATLALFVVCVVQLVRNTERIFAFCSGIGPRAYRGYAAVGLLAGVMILPFLGGLLFALGCWAIVISRIRESARFLPALVGAVILAWGFALPVVSTLSYNLGLESNRVMQDLSNLSYSPEGAELLSEASKKHPNNPLLRLSLAQLNHLKGNFGVAESEYRKVVASPDAEKGLAATAKLNLAVLEYNRGEFAKARQLLDEQLAKGTNSFELFYNLSITNLALLDTQKHREFYLQAKDVDEARLSAIDAKNAENPAPLMSGAPTTSYLPALSSSILANDTAAFEKSRARQTVLASSLLRSGNVSMLIAWGGIVVLLGVLSALSRPSPHRLKALGSAVFSETDQESSLWLLLPGGRFLAGDRPLLGAGVLTFCVLFVLAALDSPVALLPASPLTMNLDSLFFIAAASVFLIFAGLSALPGIRNTHAEAEGV